MKPVGSFLTLAYHPFYGLEPHLLFLHSLGNCPFPMQDLKITSKGTLTYHIMSMSLITIKVSNYFGNIIATKQY